MGFIASVKRRAANFYYPLKIKRRAMVCGKKIYCGSKSFVTSKTQLGNNVNFNGMAMSGNGVIKIGDNFHSGPGCQLFHPSIIIMVKKYLMMKLGLIRML